MSCPIASQAVTADGPSCLRPVENGEEPCFSPSDRISLFAELQPLVRKLMRQYGGDPDFREELPGEIFCQFVRLIEAYEVERGVPLRPYLVRGLTMAVYTIARARWRRRRREIALCAEVDALGFVPNPTPQWDHSLWQTEVLAALPSLIHDLPARQRSVLIWRYYDERSFEEIAARLQIQPATARSLLRHGLNNLRRKIADTAEPAAGRGSW